MLLLIRNKLINLTRLFTSFINLSLKDKSFILGDREILTHRDIKLSHLFKPVLNVNCVYIHTNDMTRDAYISDPQHC